ncbi:MAG: NAD(P)-binding protein, partial [Planctomycetota bacterium]
ARPAGGWVERTVRRWGWTQKSGERGEGARDEDGGEEGGAGGAKPQAAGGGDGVGPVIVVGFGPAGRAVAEAVQRRGGEVVVADLNPRSVLEARDRGLRAYVGDASQPDILKLLGAETAAAMVVTLPDHRLTVAVLVEARAANPSLAVVARARYRRYAELIEAAGSWAVVDEETQVGVKLGEELERLMTPRETTSDEGDEDHADEPDAKRDEPHGDRADGDGSHCA